MQLSVISPTFNEADNIVPLIRALERALEDIDYEILIADDDSPDLTWRKTEELALSNPRLRVLRRTSNPGLSASVIDGFDNARGEVLACIDADLQHDPSILRQMLQQIVAGGVEVTVGSRYVDGGGTGDWNFVRRLQSWLATKAAQVVLGVKVADPMSGFFMLRRQDYLAIRSELNGQGFKILLEIMSKLRPDRISEVPYTFQARVAGESKLSSKIVAQYVAQLYRLSAVGQVLSPQFTKFGTVGAIGVLVNLLVTMLILHLTGYRGWLVSAAASLTANLGNYLLNNFWTFRARAQRGVGLLKGYLSYLTMSSVGLAATTATYWALSKPALRAAREFAALDRSLLLICCQLAAICVGVGFNYTLNKALTWLPATATKPAQVVSMPHKIQKLPTSEEPKRTSAAAV